MTTWSSAFEIRRDGTYDVYKIGTDVMLAYCNTYEEAVKVAENLFKIVESAAEDELFELFEQNKE